MIPLHAKDHGCAVERFYKHPRHGIVRTFTLPLGECCLLIAMAFRPVEPVHVTPMRRPNKMRAA